MVSTHLKNISQIGSFPQFSGWKFQKYLSCHQLVILLWTTKMQQPLERSYFHDLFQSITVDWLLAERDDFFWDPPNLQSTKSASMISDPVLQLMRYDIYTWIFQVCKICAFSAKHPTKRQNFYISMIFLDLPVWVPSGCFTGCQFYMFLRV